METNTTQENKPTIDASALVKMQSAERKDAFYTFFKGHAFFEGVEQSVARAMHDNILGEIIRRGAMAARTTEESFTRNHWELVVKKMERKLMALRFCFDCLPAPATEAKEVVDVDEYAEFTAVARA